MKLAEYEKIIEKRSKIERRNKDKQGLTNSLVIQNLSRDNLENIMSKNINNSLNRSRTNVRKYSRFDTYITKSQQFRELCSHKHIQTLLKESLESNKLNKKLNDELTINNNKVNIRIKYRSFSAKENIELSHKIDNIRKQSSRVNYTLINHNGEELILPQQSIAKPLIIDKGTQHIFQSLDTLRKPEKTFSVILKKKESPAFLIKKNMATNTLRKDNFIDKDMKLHKVFNKIYTKEPNKNLFFLNKFKKLNEKINSSQKSDGMSQYQIEFKQEIERAKEKNLKILTDLERKQKLNDQFLKNDLGKLLFLKKLKD
jgi:hypothetical protein